MALLAGGHFAPQLVEEVFKETFVYSSVLARAYNKSHFARYLAELDT